MTTTVRGLEELKALAGKNLGSSGWLEITQHRVNTFADATGDHQWIHVDVERAKFGPFGGTIAHGYLTLSLIIPLFAELLDVQDVKMGVNYGLEKVRFPQPGSSGQPDPPQCQRPICAGGCRQRRTDAIRFHHRGRWLEQACLHCASSLPPLLRRLQLAGVVG